MPISAVPRVAQSGRSEANVKIDAFVGHAMWVEYCEHDFKHQVRWKSTPPEGLKHAWSAGNADFRFHTGKAVNPNLAKEFFVEKRTDGKSVWAGPFKMPEAGIPDFAKQSFVTHMSARYVGPGKAEIGYAGRLANYKWTYDFSDPVIDRKARTITISARVYRPHTGRGGQVMTASYDVLPRTLSIPKESGEWKFRIIDAESTHILKQRVFNVP